MACCIVPCYNKPPFGLSEKGDYQLIALNERVWVKTAVDVSRTLVRGTGLLFFDY